MERTTPAANANSYRVLLWCPTPGCQGKLAYRSQGLIHLAGEVAILPQGAGYRVSCRRCHKAVTIGTSQMEGWEQRLGGKLTLTQGRTPARTNI